MTTGTPDVEAPHLLQKLEAAHPWHVHVEQDEVELAQEELHDRRGAIGHRLDLIGESRRGLAEELLQHPMTDGSSSTISTRFVTPGSMQPTPGGRTRGAGLGFRKDP